MKKTILTILCGLLFTTGLFSQVGRTDTIDIHKAVQEIKANKGKYQEVEKVHTVTDDKYVYLKGNETKLITIKTLYNGIEKHVSWFYSNGQLIYTEQLGIDPASKKIVDNEKCYLRNGQLIAWVNTDNKLVDNSSSDFKTLESSLNKFGPKWYDASAK